MNWILLSEAKIISSNDDMIQTAISDSSNNDKYAPSVEFASKIYEIVNHKFFLTLYLPI